jgi:hypothetical protein
VRLISKLLASASVTLCFALIAHAAERKISKSDLPPAVQKTAQGLSMGATVKGYTQETENGKTEYEVEMTLEGHSKHITIGPDGDLLEVEEQVEMSALPTAVQLGLKAKAGAGSITKIESITKQGKTVAYEAQVKNGLKRSEIQVGLDGLPLDHEE